MLLGQEQRVARRGYGSWEILKRALPFLPGGCTVLGLDLGKVLHPMGKGQGELRSERSAEGRGLGSAACKQPRDAKGACLPLTPPATTTPPTLVPSRTGLSFRLCCQARLRPSRNRGPSPLHLAEPITTQAPAGRGPKDQGPPHYRRPLRDKESQGWPPLFS